MLTLEEFARSFTEDILAEAEQAEDGAIQETIFTQHAQEVITEAGEAVDPQLCHYRARGVRLSGYDYLEDSDEIDLFVSDFNNSDTTRTIGLTEITDLLDRGRAFLGRSLDGIWQQWEESTEAHDLAELIHGQRNNLRSARIVLLTNRLAPRNANTKDVVVGDIAVSHQVWDIERLYQVAAVSLTPTPIAVDLEAEFGGRLPCITMPAQNGIYDAYFAVIPAPVLAAIYGRWGQRLLQRNVRSFLQARGFVNKGIRDTLDKSPEMFLAYNNGISATAAEVTLTRVGEELYIRSIDNLQIVNGGQTTASIYNAYRAKADLSQAFVQMKLTVLRDASRLDEVVHLISLYANSQTKIAFSDFSANDPFHVELEKLSRQVWAPNLQGKATTKWFYERARGQYLDERSRQETMAKRKAWETQQPPRQKLTKSLVAKYEMSWRQRPDWVSEGAEKNFAQFSAWLQENPVQVDRLYFEELVAKAIVFRECDAVVKKLDFGGYKANVVTYAVAWLSYLTGPTFDMDRVWQAQTVSESTRELLQRLAQRTFEHITSPPGRVRNVSEWCKKEECWVKLRAEPVLIGDLMSELRGAARHPSDTGIQAPAMSPAQNLQLQEAVISMSARQWFALNRWIRDRKDFTTWDKNFVANCGVRISRGTAISSAQLPHALRIYMQATVEGFLLDEP